VFKNRAVYMPMVAGIRRLVQQSGEITRFEQSVVYERDQFSYQLGDDPHILHVPELGERGRPIMAYSIAQFRDGTLSREVMTVDEIEKVRANSRAGDSGPWKTWWPEMARKTVAKRHAKFLPMSNDAADAIKRDRENDFPATGEPSHVPVAPSPAGRPRLAEQLNSLGHTQAAETPRQTRGRPRKHTAQQSAEAQKVLDHYFPNDEADDDAPPKTDDNKAELTPTEQYQRDLKRDLDRDRIEAEADDGWPGPDVPPNSQSRTDMLTGRNDALAGRRSCLNKDIANNPKRFADWRRGFDSVARGQTK
jgi:recombinational DNA repair protein RecT